MRERKSIQAIIRVLAKEGPLTPYKIAHKAELSESVVHVDIKEKWGLERLNIVKVHRESEYKGRKRREYVLSFKGLVVYLDLACKSNFGRSVIKEFIERYSEFYPDCPLLTEHEFIAQRMGDRIYEWYASIARKLKFAPLHSAFTSRLARGILADAAKAGQIPNGVVGVTRESVKRCERIPILALTVQLPPEKENAALMHEYALSFIDLGIPLNATLRKFFGKTIAKESEAMRQELYELKKSKVALKKVGEKAARLSKAGPNARKRKRK